MEPQEIKEYLLSSSSKMTFETNDQLVRIINAYRNKNYLSKLKYAKSFPEFILKGNSIVKFTFNNIINLENKKYLFRYPSGVFLQMLGEKNKNIINILSLDYLNKIKYVKKDEDEYILVYDDRNAVHIQIDTNTPSSEREKINNKMILRINKKY
jgi:hypothetical protein